jgi:hypothetical protein
MVAVINLGSYWTSEWSQSVKLGSQSLKILFKN